MSNCSEGFIDTNSKQYSSGKPFSQEKLKLVGGLKF